MVQVEPHNELHVMERFDAKQLRISYMNISRLIC